MGGRGLHSGVVARQTTIYDQIERQEIADIIQECKRQREALADGGGGGITPPSLFKKCACCGEYTIPVKTKYETCLTCGWVDDPYQNGHPDSLDGKNPLSLKQAREEFRARKLG